MANDNVIKKVLPNGITVIIKEVHTSDVVACNFWVKVGASFEEKNEKGLSHFIEHMMFKGTKKYKVGEIDKKIKELGGYNNAFTSYDATNYVIVLPAEHVKKAIEIEYDAITNSIFDENEINKEREVILNELHRGLDKPTIFLWQKLMNLSFDKYYKDPIIGYEKLLKKYTREDILEYYKRYYLPDNLVIVVVGNIKSDEILKYIEDTFGQIEKKGTVVFEETEEKDKESKLKYKTYKGNIESAHLAIGFNIEDALSPDLPALEILARILGGGESSILYQNIKEKKELVDDITTDIFAGKFGGIFVIYANLREKKYEEVLKNIFSEIAQLKKFGIQYKDLEKVKADILREQGKDNMKVENIAGNLGFYEILKDYKYYYEYYDRLKTVTNDDVNKVLQKYFIPENMKIVLYYPEKELSYYKKYENINAIKNTLNVFKIKKHKEEGIITKTVLNNGITLLHKKLTNTDIVSIKFIFKGGIIYEAGEYQGYYKGITNLMLETMLKGTKEKNSEEIAEELDLLGAIFSKEIGKDYFGFSGEVLNTNFLSYMKLVSDIILHPQFSLDEMRKEKKDIINSLKKIKDEPYVYANKLFNELLFEWHPYGFYYMGDINSVRRIPVKRLKEWHKKYVTPNNLIVSVVGNVDKDYVVDIFNKFFKNWKRGKDLKIKLPVKVTNIKKIKKEKIKKNQVHIIIGFLGPKVNSKDYFTFRVLDTILSGGMNSRLFTEIRDKKNLCYTIFSTFNRTIERGAFKIYTATSPDKKDIVIREIFNVLKDLYKNGVTDEEVKIAKEYISGMYKIGMQSYMSQADSYGLYELWGLGYKKVDDFLNEIYKVKKEDVDKAIKKYFKLRNYCEVIVGPEVRNKKGK